MRKVCFKCGQEKELHEFYPHPQMGDGHLNKCKSCNRLDSKKDYDRKIKDPSWREKEKTRGRKKYHKYKYKSNSVGRQKVYNMTYPEKYAAKCASGKIVAPDGKERHHWSYNEEHYKDVIFLTKAEHMKAHRFIIYDQERKMYRTLSGILLDTRKAHENYIDDKIINEDD